MLGALQTIAAGWRAGDAALSWPSLQLIQRSLWLIECSAVGHQVGTYDRGHVQQPGGHPPNSLQRRPARFWTSGTSAATRLSTSMVSHLCGPLYLGQVNR